MSLLSKMIMMSGLEVAMAHVAGPAQHSKGEMRAKHSEKGKQLRRGEEGATGGHSTHNSNNKNEDNSQNGK